MLILSVSITMDCDCAGRHISFMLSDQLVGGIYLRQSLTQG